MRHIMILLMGFLGFLSAADTLAQRTKGPPKRYGIEADLENYPQADPKTTIASVLKAIENGKIDYLLAQLSDPQWVDERVKNVHSGKFENAVKETSKKFAIEPEALRELQRLLRDGTWQGDDAEAQVSLKDGPDHVFLRKIDTRWYLKAEKKVKDKGK